MTPYYEDDSCVIYHGDCRDILPTLSSANITREAAQHERRPALLNARFRRSPRR
jgi:hypothetical protein